jgi:hypothetical protein
MVTARPFQVRLSCAVERQRTADNMIPPPAQRQIAKRAGASVAKAKGSHAIDVSQPQAVVKLIEQAAKST